MYGGFEQLAEIVSQYLVKKGCDITVYNPTDHPYRSDLYNGVKVKRIFSNEKLLKFMGMFVFDYLCLRDALRRDFDVILELGYHPAAWFYFMRKGTKPKIVTHMAGMEWQRSKWNFFTRKFIRYLETLGVRKSDCIIADNYAMRDYFEKEYKASSYYVAYGAERLAIPQDSYLKEYDIDKYGYFMLVARFQPDNKIELTLDGYVKSGSAQPFLVVGSYDNKFGAYLKGKYKNCKNIKFIGGVYNYEKLSSLRYFSKLYFHVHSCGGTNPSLLEAMASSAYIAAYKNVFNTYVLEDDGVYYRTADEVARLIENYTDTDRDKFIKANISKIEQEYNWGKVSEEYLRLFQQISEPQH